jgi:hypothetical protein
MSKLTIEKLLAYAFSESELKPLLQDEHFSNPLEEVETVEQFEALCLLGSHLLHKHEFEEMLS